MLKKFLIILLALFLIGGVFVVYKLYKSYDIPQLDKTISIEDLNLNFDKEKLVSKNLTETKNLPLEKVNNDNHENAYLFAKKLIEDGNSQEAIPYLKKIVKLEPTNLRYINDLRVLYLEMNQTDLFLQFSGTVSQTYEIKLNNALAYVDYLQTPDLGTANLGQKSAQSINILNSILEEDPYDILAHYARGLNNLYWPAGLQRSSKSIQDLTYCVSAENTFNSTDFEFWPNCYTALGDAYVKDGQVDQGKLVWSTGLKKFPDNHQLKLRTNLSDDQALDLVREERGIDIFQRPDPSITNLNVLWE
ncbi:tetratricopeptide repeat protein [Bacillus sp. SM2101]|uniref:tetratricopeptide repeat protein n=1 Tax=Bacillus sp. SM2101 TaxID=2805366 RepID=UPI001BDF2E8A|nr:tetratricopeptide repeat protein [Bacillus sp. SM2101]